MKQVLKLSLIFVFLLLIGCAKEPRDYEYKLRSKGWITEIASEEGIAQILSNSPEYIEEVETIIVASKQSSNIGFIFFFKTKDEAKKYYEFKRILAAENEIQRVDKNIVYIGYGSQFFTDLGI